jgi:prevent-host-death family protein
MTTRVSVAEAKQHLADLLGRVAYGKEWVMITRRGRPMAVLVPPDQLRGKRHVADARGWLDGRDPFFKSVEQIVERRLTHRPRGFALQSDR